MREEAVLRLAAAPMKRRHTFLFSLRGRRRLNVCHKLACTCDASESTFPRFATRREKAALFLVPPLALSPWFSFFAVSFFGRGISVFSEKDRQLNKNPP